MLSSDEVNILGQILDDTWGRSSTPGGSGSISVKGKLSGDTLRVTYLTYSTFASNVVMSQQLPSLIHEAKQAVNVYVKEVKSSFDEKAGRSLRVKVVSADHTVDVVSLQPHVSPKRTISFRYVTTLTVK